METTVSLPLSHYVDSSLRNTGRDSGVDYYTLEVRIFDTGGTEARCIGILRIEHITAKDVANLGSSAARELSGR